MLCFQCLDVHIVLCFELLHLILHLLLPLAVSFCIPFPVVLSE